MRIVVLSGAGISAESGISTFRDANGLWEGHDIMEVASPQGWAANPDVVNAFYNARRRDVQLAKPNAAHYYFAELQSKHDVQIITQNVDDLHERAGSSDVLHLHGELLKVRSTGDKNLVYDWRKDLTLDDTCEKGFRLRPHIVWFGEDVPLIAKAAEHVSNCDLCIVIGTSLQVYPAAGLMHYAPAAAQLIYIDPKPTSIQSNRMIHVINKNATDGVLEIDSHIERMTNR